MSGPPQSGAMFCFSYVTVRSGPTQSGLDSPPPPQSGVICCFSYVTVRSGPTQSGLDPPPPQSGVICCFSYVTVRTGPPHSQVWTPPPPPTVRYGLLLQLCYSQDWTPTQSGLEPSVMSGPTQSGLDPPQPGMICCFSYVVVRSGPIQLGLDPHTVRSGPPSQVWTPPPPTHSEV